MFSISGKSKQKALQVQKKFIAISKRIPTKIKWVFVLHRSASQSCCCFIMFEACFLCSFTCFIYNNKKISHTARYQREAWLFMPRPLSAKYKMLQKSNLRFRMFFSAPPLFEVGKVPGGVCWAVFVGTAMFCNINKQQIHRTPPHCSGSQTLQTNPI